MRVCIKCGIEKDIEAFYLRRSLKNNGRYHTCKECAKIIGKQIREKDKLDFEKVLKLRERSRNKDRSNYKQKNKPGDSRKHAIKYPEKTQARKICQYLKPEVKGNILHHWSYHLEDGLDLIELTRRVHSKIHRHLIYDQKYKIYRRCDDETLLDSRQKHLDFINICKEDNFNFFIKPGCKQILIKPHAKHLKRKRKVELTLNQKWILNMIKFKNTIVTVSEIRHEYKQEFSIQTKSTQIFQMLNRLIYLNLIEKVSLGEYRIKTISD